MDETWQVALLSLGAGLAIPMGGLTACFENIQPDWLESEVRHTVTAFGAGALLSAVCLALLPEGIEHLRWTAVATWFALGGLTFMGLDVLLAKFDSPAANLVATLSDFIPESIALGAAFGAGGGGGVVLALLIALQNLPEGFNAFREMRDADLARPAKLLVAFLGLAAVGPICGLTGFFVLAGHPVILASLAVFASGGILYLVVQDIAPQAKLENHRAPALGANAGFGLGLVAHMLTG